MAALPYMQLYVADYLADTAHLTAAQHGAYLLLLFNYWQRGKPLNNLNERLANVARMSNEEWAENKDALVEFFVVDGDEWHHSRVDDDLAAVLAKSTKAAASGKASGNARSASVEQKTNGRSTDVQRTLNHTDVDTDKEVNLKPPSLREVPPLGKEKKQTFKAWLAEIALAGEKPISAYKPVFEYAKTVGLSEEWIQIAWIKFSERYTKDKNHSGKRYIDWRQTFLNAIKDNWFKLWYAKEGVFMLTTVGIQTDIETREVA